MESEDWLWWLPLMGIITLGLSAIGLTVWLEKSEMDLLERELNFKLLNTSPNCEVQLLEQEREFLRGYYELKIAYEKEKLNKICEAFPKCVTEK